MSFPIQQQQQQQQEQQQQQWQQHEPHTRHVMLCNYNQSTLSVAEPTVQAWQLLDIDAACKRCYLPYRSVRASNSMRAAARRWCMLGSCSRRTAAANIVACLGCIVHERGVILGAAACRWCTLVSY